MTSKKQENLQSEKPTHKNYDSAGQITVNGKKINYDATASWLPLHQEDEETARIFHTYYRLAASTRFNAAKRPVTFVFNGGPGAASAYLHVGAVGPKRVSANPDGTLPPAPVRLVDNSETWLSFTDLVFIDPVGTGLSRSVKKNTPQEGEPTPGKPQDKDDTFYWDVGNDLNALCDFISAFLSREKRWRSPVCVAGESYGGYRTARLARMLQEQAGVGINAAIVISPVLEWDNIFSGHYNTLGQAMLLPSLAAAARFHGRSSQAKTRERLDTYLLRAEEFALKQFLPDMSQGIRLSAAGLDKAYRTCASWCGLDAALVARHNGHIDASTFCRELLRDEHKALGRYDAAMTTIDPFPATDTFTGVDPTLGGLDRLYTAGANAHLRENLGVDSEQKYELLSMSVNRKWQWRDAESGSPVPAGATDDLAAGLAMNPDMKVMIVHGVYDLVTPYFESKFLSEQLARSTPIGGQLEINNYEGGHMFYMWEKSRKLFTRDVAKMIKEAY